MELRHLRYFVAVAEEENVTRAAERLHISQPPLSRQIRDLEDELGLALFDRSAKSLHLTGEGRVFLSEAKAVLARAEEAEGVARALASGHRGEIDVGYAPSLTVEILPAALRKFGDICPGIRARLRDLSTQEMLGGLLAGTLQVALMVKPAGRFPAKLVFEKLRDYPVCIALHPSHPLSKNRGIRLSDIAGERLIAYTREDYPEYHDWIGKIFSSEKRRPRIAEEHDSSASLIASVEAGHGIALVHGAFECFSGPRLKILPITPAPPSHAVVIACRKDSLSGATRHFISAAKEAEGLP